MSRGSLPRKAVSRSFAALTMTAITVVMASGLSPSLAQASTPVATIDLPAKAKWHQLTSLGLLLVGTDQSLMLVNGDTGAVQWTRDDIKKTSAFNVREIPGSPILLINDWTGAIGSKVTTQGISMATGETVFRSEPEAGFNLAVYSVPDGKHALNIGVIFNVEKFGLAETGVFATLINAADGQVVWRTRIADQGDIKMHPADGSTFNTRLDLSGHQDPVFDAGTVYLPFTGLMALDLASGAMKWQVKYATADEALKRAYSAPVISGDTIFASGRGTVYAIDKATGTTKWKSDKVASGFFSSAVISQVLPTNDAVYVRLGGNFQNGFTKGFELKEPLGVIELNRETGQKSWEYKKSKEGITNLIVLNDQGAIMLADAYNLTGLDVDAAGKGAAKFEVPIEFKRKMSGGEMAVAGLSTLSGFMTGGLAGAMRGGIGAVNNKGRLDIPVALLPRPDGDVIVAGKQHLMRFDPRSQKIDWSIYYPAPGGSTFGLVVMSALTVAAARGYSDMQAGASATSAMTMDRNNASNYTWLNDYSAKRYSASQQARDNSYVLTTVTVGKESGTGVMAINLETGEPGAQVLLKDKEPEYVVDEIDGRMYYFNDKKKLLIYGLK